MSDLKYAWRALRHGRASTLLAVFCLALGIGANVALFGVLDALLFKPPAGVAAADELVRVRAGSPTALSRWSTGPSVNYPTYRHAAERFAGVANVAAYAPRAVSLNAGERPERLDAVVVSGNYFDVLGVRASTGRLFMASADDRTGAEPVAVLSHGEWQRRFGGTAAAVGSRLEVNGVSVRIIGIAPRGFVGVDLGEPDLWLPLSLAARDEFGGARQLTERVYWLQLVARRAPGTTPAAFEHVAAGVRADPAVPITPFHLEPLRPMFFAEHAGRSPVPLWSVGITLLVLLLSCATVANILLARGAAREREIAVRLALGAPRARVLRQLLLENGLIALAAALAATILAGWSRGLLRVLPVPDIHRFIDLRVAGFAFIVAAATTLLFGLLPALWTARGDLDPVLRRSSAALTRGGALQRSLMSVQVALSFLLLVGAGLFAASFENVRRIDPGFALDRLALASFDLLTLPGGESARVMADAAARVRRLPGVQGAAAGGTVPFYFFNRSGFGIPDGRGEDAQPTGVIINAVGAGYFDVLGIGIMAGRAFDERDQAGAPAVAMVSDALAREYWPGASPIGRCIELARECVTVIGVTRDVRFEDLRGRASPVLFLPATQRPGAATTLFVRVVGDPAPIAPLIAAALHDADRSLPYVNAMPLEVRARPQRIPWEVAATLFAAFGVVATLLAAVGLYMLISYITDQRTRELCVRAALGADRARLAQLVIRQTAAILGWGIGAGAVIAFAFGRLLTGTLHGVAPTHPRSWVAAALLLAVTALVASAAPARRAARLEPATVLREQ